MITLINKSNFYLITVSSDNPRNLSIAFEDLLLGPWMITAKSCRQPTKMISLNLSHKVGIREKYEVADKVGRLECRIK